MNILSKVRKVVRNIATFYNKLSPLQLVLYLTGICIAVLAFTTLAAYKHYTYSSDDIANQQIFQSILKTGEMQAATGTDNFTIKAPLYLLSDILAVNSPAKVLGVTLLFNVIMIAGYSVLIYQYAKHRPKGYRAKLPLLFLPMLAFLSISAAPFANGDISQATRELMLLNPNYRNLEIGLLFAVTAYLAHILSLAKKRFSWRKEWPFQLGAALVLGYLFYSDPLFIYVLGGGVVITSFYLWVRTSKTFAPSCL